MRWIAALCSAWTWRMAWRESRTARRRLLLFSSSISLGIAALVALACLGRNLRDAIEAQSKSLLGADLVFTRREPFAQEDRNLIQRLGGQVAVETSFSTMLSLESGSRLVNARAISGGFPFYGTLETDPPEAAIEFRKAGGVLVEQGVLTQFGSRVGDTARLGESRFRILGALRRAPGDTVAFSTLAPRVYLSTGDLAATGLLRPGSLARYRLMVALPSTATSDPEALLSPIESELSRRHIEVDTVKKRQRDLGDSLVNLHRFLNLVGLVALVLGAIGIASAMQVHVRQKLPHAALLRCLGATTPQVFAVYLAQGIGLGLFGSAVGAVLGAGTAQYFPRLVGTFIPFPFEARFAWIEATSATGAGLALCLLFTLLPLLEIRGTPPLAVLRVSDERRTRFDPVRGWVVAVIVLGLSAFTVSQARNWIEGLSIAGGLAVAFALLAGTARTMMWGTRRFLPRRWPFVWRQGIASLYRPRNRTTLMVLSLGLGTFLILTLHLVRENLLTQLFPPSASGKPNTILFDIQPDQRPGVLQLMVQHHLPTLEQAPIVTMRIAQLKGSATEQRVRTNSVPTSAQEESRTARPRSDWALRREYRSTWRDQLIDTETVIAGTWIGRMRGEPSPGNPVPVSLEDGIAKELGVTVGDAISFDVQGVEIPCRVASLRRVDWRQVRPNFFVLFPAGSLEEAPSQFVVATRVETSLASGAFQRDLLRAFPNVSTVDLTLVLQTLDGILTRVGFVVRFMALFTVLTGLVVLAGAILTGRWQRLQEAVLLRTLGASRTQIRQILLAEYLTLGSMAAATGILLAIVASASMSAFLFHAPPHLSLLPLGLTWVSVTALTVAVGLFGSRGIAQQSPLEILRQEG